MRCGAIHHSFSSLGTTAQVHCNLLYKNIQLHVCYENVSLMRSSLLWSPRADDINMYTMFHKKVLSLS